MFLTGDALRAVQPLRELWDSQRAAGIAPHVTLAYALSDTGVARLQLEELADRTPCFQIGLGHAIRWGPPDDGIALEVVDHDGGLSSILEASLLRGFRATNRAHVTLVHAHGAEPPASLDEAWRALKDLHLEVRQVVDSITVVEERGDGWVRLYDCPMQRCP